MAMVSVFDQGTGIPQGEEDKLFDKFYRLHPDGYRSGVGLGLAICKAIILAHGGVIGVRNTENGGAQFYFMLPMDEVPPQIPLMDEEMY
jgi:two-component system sensor histidine kinase KdpD